MAKILEETSTITAKGQTTIPKSVRRALGVDVGGRIAFRVDERGVSVHRAEAEGDDPAIEAFLGFLGRDLERRPEAVRPVPAALAAQLTALTRGMDIDLADPIDGDVAL